MSIPTKEFLSGSTDGKNIPILATATPGTIIHTAVTGTVQKDEIFIDLCNISSTDSVVTIEFGGVAAGDQTIMTIPAQSGWQHVVAGRPINNAAVVKIFADVTAVLNCGGYVNRI